MGIGGGSLMGTMVQGAAFGAGSEVGHQAVRSMMGGSGGGSSHEGHQEPAAAQQVDYAGAAGEQMQPI